MVGTVATTEAHPLQGWLPHFSLPTDCGLSVAISPEFSIEAPSSDFAMNCPDQFLIKLLTVFKKIRHSVLNIRAHLSAGSQQLVVSGLYP